jgi:hypothetical protein
MASFNGFPHEPTARLLITEVGRVPELSLKTPIPVDRYTHIPSCTTIPVGLTQKSPVPYNEDMQSIEAVMDAELHRIRKILEIYLARSEAACTALASEDWDSFDSAMRWRNAAFHNFRAADHMVRLNRSDYLEDPDLHSLGLSLQAAEQRLKHEMEQHRDRMSEKLVKISQHRAKIGKFYSGVQEQAGFQKSV